LLTRNGWTILRAAFWELLLPRYGQGPSLRVVPTGPAWSRSKSRAHWPKSESQVPTASASGPGPGPSHVPTGPGPGQSPVSTGPGRPPVTCLLAPGQPEALPSHVHIGPVRVTCRHRLAGARSDSVTCPLARAQVRVTCPLFRAHVHVTFPLTRPSPCHCDIPTGPGQVRVTLPGQTMGKSRVRIVQHRGGSARGPLESAWRGRPGVTVAGTPGPA
jgi:hypothetical protein